MPVHTSGAPNALATVVLCSVSTQARDVPHSAIDTSPRSLLNTTVRVPPSHLPPRAPRQQSSLQSPMDHSAVQGTPETVSPPLSEAARARRERAARRAQLAAQREETLRPRTSSRQNPVPVASVVAQLQPSHDVSTVSSSPRECLCSLSILWLHLPAMGPGRLHETTFSPTLPAIGDHPHPTVDGPNSTADGSSSAVSLMPLFQGWSCHMRHYGTGSRNLCMPRCRCPRRACPWTSMASPHAGVCVPLWCPTITDENDYATRPPGGHNSLRSPSAPTNPHRPSQLYSALTWYSRVYALAASDPA